MQLNWLLFNQYDCNAEKIVGNLEGSNVGFKLAILEFQIVGLEDKSENDCLWP